MQTSYLPRTKVLQSSASIVLGSRPNSQGSLLTVLQSVTTRGVYQLDNIYLWAGFPTLGRLNHTCPIPLFTKSCVQESAKISSTFKLTRGTESTPSSSLYQFELGLGVVKSFGRMMIECWTKPSNVYQEVMLGLCQSGQKGVLVRSTLAGHNRGLQYSKKISGCLRNREPCSKNMLYKCFWSDVSGSIWKTGHHLESWMKNFSLSSTPSSTGAVPNISFDGFSHEEQLENSGSSPDLKLSGERNLKLLSGSCYLPHPEKEETGGEDAHFICNEHAIGVADGVGGWADLGVNAGHYARELMSHSVSAIAEEPKGSIDPARVLEKAYVSTKARGSSTACIVALTDQGVHAVNLGDSGFIIVREGCDVFRSPVQQHDFNFTYQLESGNASDLPSSGQVFTFPVMTGDVIVAGTDGLFDNLYTDEVTTVVLHATKAGLGPQATAQKIAALARRHALDRNRQTPFSAAAQEAGYRYRGGKLDDITVVVSYVTASSP